MNAPHWTSAEFVESRVLPLLWAFGLGVVVAIGANDRRAGQQIDQAQRAAAQAQSQARKAEALQSLYAQACGPLLSMPIEATPQLLSARPSEASR